MGRRATGQKKKIVTCLASKREHKNILDRMVAGIPGALSDFNFIMSAI